MAYREELRAHRRRMKRPTGGRHVHRWPRVRRGEFVSWDYAPKAGWIARLLGWLCGIGRTVARHVRVHV